MKNRDVDRYGRNRREETELKGKRNGEWEPCEEEK